MTTTESVQNNEPLWDNFNLFATTKETEKEETIDFQGKIPEWLNGTLYRNGPGAFEINDDPNNVVNHAFDGFAFIQKYAIDGSSQKVRFRGSFVKSYAYTEAKKQGHLVCRQFGTDPCKSLFGRFQTLFRGRGPTVRTDDTGVTVQVVNNELLALTEAPVGNIMDPNTLEYLGPMLSMPYMKPVESEIFTLTTAHVMYDPKRRMTIGYAGHVSLKKHWLDVVFIYDDVNDKPRSEQDDDEEATWLDGKDKFIHLTSRLSERGKNYNNELRSKTKSFRFEYDQVSYMHSASFTDDYLIFTEIPLHFNKYYAIWNSLYGGTATDMFKWNGDTMPTYFRVIHLDTGEQVARIPGPAFFTFHHINSYQSEENPKKIITDICAVDDSRLINELYLNKLRQNTFPSGGGYTRRFELDLENQSCVEPNAGARSGEGLHPISHSNSLVPIQYELPRINPNFIGKNYRFVYVVRAVPDRFFDALVKIDVVSKKQVAVWQEVCTSPSEPIFVARPDADPKDEEDGVVLSVILDQREKRSYLLVLDGRTFEELGRADLPVHIPLSFHGNFYSA